MTFGIACRAVTQRGAFRYTSGFSHGSLVRRLSLVSIHSVFPASLLRLQLQRESKLIEHSNSRKDMNPDNTVLVSDDGLVYPRLSAEMPC